MNRQQWDQIANRFEEAIFDITNTDENRVLQRLVKSVPLSRRRSVLVDLGCGIGTFIQKYGPLFHAIVAVDYSARMLARAKDRCSTLSQVEWLHIDIKRVARIIGPRADLTVCLNVLTSPSAPYCEALWSSAAAVTRFGGFALIVVPSIESAGLVTGLNDIGATLVSRGSSPVTGGLVQTGDDLQKYYSRREIIDTATRHGLLVKSVRRVPYPWSEEGLSKPPVFRTLRPWDWACLACRSMKA